METTKFRSLFPSIATNGLLSDPLLDLFFSENISSPGYFSKRPNIEIDENGATVEIPLPGACKDDVNISIKESDKLIVEVNKNVKFSGGQIYKFKLLAELDVENISAEMKNGLLVINVPKKKSFQDKFIKIK